MPRPRTQALVVSNADNIFILALLASSRFRSNILGLLRLDDPSHTYDVNGTFCLAILLTLL